MTVALNRRSLILALARRILGRPRARLRLGVGLRFCRGFGRGAAWLGGGLLAAARASCLDEADGFFQRDRFRGEVGRQRGVHPVVAGIGPVTSVLDHDGAALVGMIAERAAGIAAAAALVGPLGALLLDQRHGAVEPDGEHVVARREIGVGLAVLHIGPEAADAGNDRLAVVGMLADLARE